MASWMIHLRIADALLPHWKDLPETPFILGNLAPDSGVPNADWTAFTPPYAVTHFQRETEHGKVIDAEAFRAQWLRPEDSKEDYAFFLGYYVHLLTDIRWSATVYAPLKRDYPKEYAENKRALIEAAKADWYDLDYLYLEEHPDFPAFRLYAEAANYPHPFTALFAPDALENRRQYIVNFYRTGPHGDLRRPYRYLTPGEAEGFVGETVKWLLQEVQR